MSIFAKTAVIALALAALVIAGCGSDSDPNDSEAQVRSIAEQTIEAGKTGNYAQVCKEAGMSLDSCEPKRPAGISASVWKQAQAASMEYAETMKIKTVTVNGDSATVEMITDGGTTSLKLTKKDGKWQPDFDSISQ